MMITVSIVDDHKIVADGLEKIIEKSNIAQVAWKAHTAADSLIKLANIQPQVLLLDIGLPDKSGLDLCPQIKALYPNVRIIMLTSYAEYAFIRHALRNGASGYILKNSEAEEIIDGIRTVAVGAFESGKIFLCQEAHTMLSKSREVAIQLTRREHELLSLIAQGKTSIEIADKMNLGYETVRSYRKNLHVKLGTHNAAELTKLAIDLTLTSSVRP
ncbi:MAG: response regulator transcription factor [Bacteroidales bacterium]|jgi:DNA-binding NarL/FixJ family response regulator|nr:response regulator transcription factor [Bacteroidales bacterium]